jgi:hypothetical protein
MENKKFRLGRLVMTRGINNMVAEDENFAKFVNNSLQRHKKGDWGDLEKEDNDENELSLKKGFRILSAYNYQQIKIWIITEADRSSTTILFPEEY